MSFEKYIARRLNELDLPTIPRVIHSVRNNLSTVTDAAHWRVDDKVLNWSDLKCNHYLLIHTLKLYITNLIEQKTPDTVHKNFRRMISGCDHGLMFPNPSVVSDFDVRGGLASSIRRSISESKSTVGRQIITFFKYYYIFLKENCSILFSEECYQFLCDVRIQKVPIGKGIMTLDPRKGPLSRLDEIVLSSHLESANKSASIEVIILILHAWGLRPRQVSMLDRDDLIVSEVQGRKSYILRVQRVKQRSGSSRGSYKLRRLTENVGARLLSYLNTSNHGISPKKDAPSPMFVVRNQGHVSRMSPKALSTAVRDFPRLRGIVSPVTGAQMVLSPKRLRETFGTRCAEMPGMTRELLGEMLDHGSTRSLDVYFDFRESIAIEIGRLVGAQTGYGTLRDLTQRFLSPEGDSEMPTRVEMPIRFLHSTEVMGDSLSSELRYFPPEIAREKADVLPALGRCGGKFRCGIAPIMTCYSCQDFEPWIEADHESIVRWIESYHDKALAEGRRADAEELAFLVVKAKLVSQQAKKMLER